MIALSLRFAESIKPFGQEAVAKVIKVLDKRLNPAYTTIGVRVVGVDEVRRLNKKYAGKDEATDVLSFNYSEKAKLADQDKSGDAVISYQHLLEQARKARTSAETELALLTLHAVLHILGHDHQDQAQRQQLDRLQADIMKAAGLEYRDFAWQD